MTVPRSAVPAELGLLTRMREAAGRIQWRDLPAPRGKATSGTTTRSRRRAHLFEEEATFELTRNGRKTVALCDSGPVGALLLLLEVDRRGRPVSLRAFPAGARPGFTGGSIEAAWGPSSAPKRLELPLEDLVGLARYALA